MAKICLFQKLGTLLCNSQWAGLCGNRPAAGGKPGFLMAGGFARKLPKPSNFFQNRPGSLGFRLPSNYGRSLPQKSPGWRRSERPTALERFRHHGRHYTARELSSETSMPKEARAAGDGASGSGCLWALCWPSSRCRDSLSFVSRIRRRRRSASCTGPICNHKTCRTCRRGPTP